MSTVGFGDMSAHNSWERFITTWIMLIGVAVYTVMLGAVTALLQNRQLGERVFEETMAQMTSYLRFRGVHDGLRVRTREYFDFCYPQRVMFDESTVLAMLPPKLRADVKLDMYKDVVSAIPFLPDEEEIALKGGAAAETTLHSIRLMIAGILKPLTVMDEQTVVHEGSIGHEMYLIVHGAVAVQFAGGGASDLKLGVCDCFGEMSALLPDRLWQATVVSLGMSTLVKIERIELDWLRHEFSELESAIQQYLSLDLATARKQMAVLDSNGDGRPDGDLRLVETHGGLGLTAPADERGELRDSHGSARDGGEQQGMSQRARPRFESVDEMLEDGGGPEGQPATDAEVSTAVETNALAEMLQQVLRAQRRQEEKLNYLCKEFRELSSRQRVNG